MILELQAVLVLAAAAALDEPGEQIVGPQGFERRKGDAMRANQRVTQRHGQRGELEDGRRVRLRDELDRPGEAYRLTVASYLGRAEI